MPSERMTKLSKPNDLQRIIKLNNVQYKEEFINEK